MGPPQLFDFTKAGDLGSNYLVYEVRRTNSWMFCYILLNYAINRENTDTVVYYFDEVGILTGYGVSKNTPTTKRQGLTLLMPWAMCEIVK